MNYLEVLTMAGGPGSYVFGAEEKKDLMDVIEAGALFRYGTPGVDGFQGKVATFEKEMAEQLGHKYVVATNAGTSSLMACLAALGIGMGDEVIVPGYTFIASISTIIMMNAIPVLAEIDESLTIDPDKIEALITPRTKAIVPVHMLGNPCKMDKIMEIAEKYHLTVIEDAAQGIMSSYKGRALGTIGDFGAFSFHETKNFSMGEGGALLIRDEKHIEDAEIIREKGTNRSKFFRGQIDKYTWVNFGSSYLPSEMNVAYVYAQLEIADEITNHRLDCWNRYYERLKPLADAGKIELPVVPDGCVHNAHMFYIKAADLAQRSAFIQFMKENEIMCVFHYIPLHTAPAGLKYGRFHGEDKYTTKESERLVRLPMFYKLTLEQVDHICDKVIEFFEG